MIISWLLVMAFEFHAVGGREAAMVAATAGDWSSAFTANPALVASAGRVNLTAGYCRPFGLQAVNRVSVGAAVGLGNWALAAGASSLGYDRYRESEANVCGGFCPAGGVALGTGIRWLIVDQGSRGVEMAPALDVGVTWQVGRLRLGAAGRGLNRPGLGSVGVIQPVLALGTAIAPVAELNFALDARYDSGRLAGAFGCEFLIVPQVAIRAGVGTDPFLYAGGVGIRVGPVGLDYACRFHPRLKETHSLGLVAAWQH